MNNSTKFLVNEDNNNKRLDIFLSEKIDYLTRTYIKKIIELKNVKINEEVINSPSKKVKLNDLIIVDVITKNTKKLLPNKIK